MKAARAIALLSYRHYETYLHSQPHSNAFPFSDKWIGADSYQRYQGEKLAKRFNAFSYYTLSKSMDAHNVGRGRISVHDALQIINAKTLAIGIQTDILFPIIEQQFIAANIPFALYKTIHSPYGHDGFLLEFEAIGNLIKEFIYKEKKANHKFAVIN
jgi:homoserine O-acetyltransferase/O-succinyltransferase